MGEHGATTLDAEGFLLTSVETRVENPGKRVASDDCTEDVNGKKKRGGEVDSRPSVAFIADEAT